MTGMPAVTRLRHWITAIRVFACGRRRSRAVRRLGRTTSLAALVAALAVAVIFRHHHVHETEHRQQRAEHLLGATVGPATGIRPIMLVVTSIRSGIADEPLRVGDRIMAIDGRPAPTLDSFAARLSQTRGDHIELVVERAGMHRPARLSVPLTQMEAVNEPQDPAGR